MVRGIAITDTTLRDAHQSLMATRMRTDSMLPIAAKIDLVGFHSVEVWGGATFDVAIRYLNEDPWDRIRKLKREFKRTPLQMLLRGQNLVGYRNYPDDIVEKFVEKAAFAGIDVFRIFDALNDARNLETAVRSVKRIRAHAQGTICYTVSPVHTLEKYLELAKQLAALDCDSICIKDMSGILSPKAGYDLVKALKSEIGLPVEVHSHCSSGMAAITYVWICEAGVDILDTAFSPFAGGASQPAVESLVSALAGTRFDTGLDLGLIVEISEYFAELREKYFDPLNLIDPRSERVDVHVLLHQIPGGMVSNLIEQLKGMNSLQRLEEVLQEVPRVREDLGYPPMVTPMSQIVGTQAVMNVISGQRYKIVSKETKDYVKGLYGRHPSPIRKDIKSQIIGDEELITCRPADLLKPEFEKMTKEVGDLATSEEDVLTYTMFPQTALKFLKTKKEGRKRTEEEEAAVAAALAAVLTQERPRIPIRREEFV